MGTVLNYLAVDIGASSGRSILGTFDGNHLTLEEKFRFPTGATLLPSVDKNGKISTCLQWDVLSFFNAMLDGVKRIIRQDGNDLHSIGLDTWGVDFGLLDRHGILLSNPFHYRDARTDGMLSEAFNRMPRERIFEITGIQFLQINTLYQLLAMVVSQSPILEAADTFLTIPDLFNYWLTGVKTCEYTIASTTQCLDAVKHDWSGELLSAMGIPAGIFPEIVQPGTKLGALLPEFAEQVGGSLQVIAPACHDTGSAAFAVSAEPGACAWISSGTWSVVGTNVPSPVINDLTDRYNFTNEGGAFSDYRLSRNVMGLWLLQECRRIWAGQGNDYDFDQLDQMAAKAPAMMSVIDPDDPGFLKPGDMPVLIQNYCRQHEQPVPQDEGAIVRCILESMALKYRWVVERLDEILGTHLNYICVVGGGVKNKLLCQFTADATGRPVVTGPVEATAAGNILMQLVADGRIGSQREAKAVVKRSFKLRPYDPQNHEKWNEGYGHLLKLLEGNGS